jgi:uncharacterized Zn finger protein (UPF0148 family)
VSVVYSCPDCGTDLEDDGGLWCPECERPVPAGEIRAARREAQR